MSQTTHDLNKARSAMQREARFVESYSKQGLTADATRHRNWYNEAAAEYDRALAKYTAEQTAEALKRR